MVTTHGKVLWMNLLHSDVYIQILISKRLPSKFNILSYSKYKPIWYRAAKTARHGRAHLAYKDELRPHLLKYANQHVASISNFSYPDESTDLSQDWRIVILAKPHIIFTIRFAYADIEKAKEHTIDLVSNILSSSRADKNYKYATRIVAYHEERTNMVQGKKSTKSNDL